MTETARDRSASEPARPAHVSAAVLETKPGANPDLSSGVAAQATILTTARETPRLEPVEGDGPNHPLVKCAMELFGARVVDIQPRRM